jgi:uncharacterized membrane protein
MNGALAYEHGGGLALRRMRASARNGSGHARGSRLLGQINVGSRERAASFVMGGALLALGMGRSGTGKALLSVLGGSLLFRGLSGHCPVYQTLGADTSDAAQREHDASLTQGPELDAPEVQRSVTIGRPRAELFELWRRPETQTKIMAHFAQVSAGERGGLRIQIAAPLGKTLRLETVVVEERSGELVRWRSGPGADLPSEWSALFREAPGDFGTELTLQVRFEPPGGVVGSALSKLLGIAPRLLVERCLRNFKSLVESGEIPSAFHNPSARRGSRSDTQAPHALRATHRKDNDHASTLLERHQRSARRNGAGSRNHQSARRDPACHDVDDVRLRSALHRWLHPGYARRRRDRARVHG